MTPAERRTLTELRDALRETMEAQSASRLRRVRPANRRAGDRATRTSTLRGTLRRVLRAWKSRGRQLGRSPSKW